MQDDTPTTATDTAAAIFGRERLQMVTGGHVEVFREAAAPGERLRYSKRFLATPDGDYRPWTEREWQILVRLASGGRVPAAQVAGFDAQMPGQPAQLQTYDAGVTAEQWTLLLPSHPDRPPVNHVFEDCAHWWALAHHSLKALDALHARNLVHLDFKADNLCIPWIHARWVLPASAPPFTLRFAELTLIDFAFALFSGEDPPHPLPLGRHGRYDYQSPRLLDALGAARRGNLAPTRMLDWRCDFFSLAAMLWLYLPELGEGAARSWTADRHAQANVLVRRLLDEHNGNLPTERPHKVLMGLTGELLSHLDLAASLRQGWNLGPRGADPLGPWTTPPTRIAASTLRPGLEREAEPLAPDLVAERPVLPPDRRWRRERPARSATSIAAAVLLIGAALGGVAWWMLERWPTAMDTTAVAPAPAMPEAAPPPLDAVAAAAAPAPTVAPAVQAPAVAPPVQAPAPAPPIPAIPAPTESVAVAPEASPSPAEPAATAAPATTAAATERAPRPSPGSDTADERPVSTGTSDPVANALLTSAIPQMAEWADRRFARVLKLGEPPGPLPQREAVRAAVTTARLGPGRPPLNLKELRSQEARRLNEAARVAYWQHSNVPEAVSLQTRALRANPLDAEIVGNLAFLRMRQQPPQYRAARQLALHSLALTHTRDPTGRVQDWTTLAIANALTGRETEARDAWALSLALSPDPRGQRAAATRAIDLYGERLRPSVEAMLQRAVAAERSRASPARKSGRRTGGRS